MKRDPRKRLDFFSLTKHPFFAGLDWHHVVQKTIPAPIVPQLMGEDDVSAFDDAFTEMYAGITPNETQPTPSVLVLRQTYPVMSGSESEPDIRAEDFEEEGPLDRDFFSKMLKIEHRQHKKRQT